MNQQARGSRFDADDEAPRRRFGSLKGWLLVLLFALPALWRWTPLNQWINLATIIEWQDSMRSSPAAPYLLVGAYVLASLAFFPVTLLNLATVFTFGPLWGNVYGLAGWVLSATVGYAIGGFFGREMLRKMTSRRLHRILGEAGRHGFLSVLTIRVMPVAPFTLVNIFVGASVIRFWEFLLGTLVGRIPGIVTLTLFGFQIESILRRADVAKFIFLGVALLLLLVAVWRFKTARFIRSSAAKLAALVARR
jgi:phospholipase D1/2